MPGPRKDERHAHEFPVERGAMIAQSVISKRFAVIGGHDYEGVLQNALPVKVCQKTANVIVFVFQASIVFVDGSSVIPERFAISRRAAIGIVNVEIGEECEERVIAIAFNPTSCLAVEFVGSFANAERAAILARSFRVLVEPV